MRILCTGLLLSALVSFTRLAWSASPVVAVLEIQNDTKLPKATSSKATDYLRVKLSESGVYRVVDKSEQEAQLKLLVQDQKKESYKACYDQSCQIPLGKELAADKILRGKLTNFGKTFILTVEMIDLASSASAGGASAKCEGNEEALVGAVEEIAAKLVSDARPPPPPPPPAVVAPPPPPPVAAPPQAGGSWDTRPVTLGPALGRSVSITCPPNGQNGVVWGTDTYTTDSSLCTAALHAGRLTRDAGGPVTITFIAGLPSYAGTTRNGVTTSSWGAYPMSFVFTSAALAPPSSAPADARPAAWNTSATSLRGTSAPVSFTCPPGGTAATVWGSGPYTDDSSVCTAAVHAGVFGFGGGTVTIKPEPGQPSYAGTGKNGVTTLGYGTFAGSFRVSGGGASNAGPTVAASWTTNASQFRGRIGQRFRFDCPAFGVITAPIWGSSPYTDDSAICVAAVHAGVITPNSGGPVTIEIRPSEPAYRGSPQNGVSSNPYATYPGSYTFAP